MITCPTFNFNGDPLRRGRGLRVRLRRGLLLFEGNLGLGSRLGLLRDGRLLTAERLAVHTRKKVELHGGLPYGYLFFDLTRDGAVELKLSPASFRAELTSPRPGGPSLSLEKESAADRR